MASLTMPTTPKASTTRRDFSFGDAVKGGLAKSQPAAASVILDESEDHDLDGRLTPVPGSNSSSSRTNTSSSPPSTTPPLTPGDRDPPSQPSVPDTARSFPSAPIGSLVIPQAIHGFGQLAGEEQLKFALQSKDRIFVVMVSNEIEAFIARVLAGEKPMEAQSLPHAVYTQTNLSILGSSVKMQTISTSKFQRMLMYRAAEWYGVKCVTGPVTGPEAVMYVGTLGEVAEKSGKLKLPTLVPEREKQQQKFQIMQRRPNSSTATANGAIANGSGNGEGGPTSRKTLEQREAEYAQARERIFQKQGEESAAASDNVERERGREPSRARRGEEDDLGPTASRFPVQRPFEPVYASLYHSQLDNAALAANNMGQQAYDSSMGMLPHQAYYGTDGQYGMYPMQLPHGGQYADPYAMGALQMPIPPVPMQVPPSGHQAYTPAQGYDLNGQPILLVSNGMGGYVPWGPQTNMPMQVPGVPGAQGVSAQPGMGLGGVPPPSGGMGMPPMQQPQWTYGNPATRAPPNASHPHPYPNAMNVNQSPPPPSISGHSAFSSPTSLSSFSGYSGTGSAAGPSRQSSGTFGGQNTNLHLQQPKPQRPQVRQQNSYASSSISSSSRSYQQDYPHSRPHSRGSTTSTVASTRSAGSNVRLGAMYPANAAPGYAGYAHGQYVGGNVYPQHGVNGHQQPQVQQQAGGRGKHMVREVNGLTSLNIGRDRRGRGQSPSGSTTTTSSRSSRRTNAHAAQAANGAAQPYHPLPQRPDWSTASASAAPSVSGSSVSGAGQANVPAAADAATPPSVSDSISPMSPSVGSTIPPSSPAQSELASVSVDGQADVLSDAVAGVKEIVQQGQAVEIGGEMVNAPTAEAMPSVPDITINSLAPIAASLPSAEAPVTRPEDPDFPARGPVTSNQTLFNPKPASIKGGLGAVPSNSAPRAPPTGSASRNVNSPSAPSGPIGTFVPTLSTPRLATATIPASASIPGLVVDENGMSAEDIIEAKLRAISVTTGVDIGPKPARATSGSYAKAVRRE